MKIKLGEKECQIKEYATYWTVVLEEGKLSANFNLSKSDFATVDQVKKFCIQRYCAELISPDWFELYKSLISKEVIPLYQVMGNEILSKKFNYNTIEVYKYCVENNVKWEDVLEYEEIPGVIY